MAVVLTAAVVVVACSTGVALPADGPTSDASTAAVPAAEPTWSDRLANLRTASQPAAACTDEGLRDYRLRGSPSGNAAGDEVWVEALRPVGTYPVIWPFRYSGLFAPQFELHNEAGERVAIDGDILAIGGSQRDDGSLAVCAIVAVNGRRLPVQAAASAPPGVGTVSLSACEEGGAPVRGYTVDFIGLQDQRAPNTLTVDATGDGACGPRRFTIGAGRWLVSVLPANSHRYYEHLTQEITIEAGRTVSASFRFQPLLTGQGSGIVRVIVCGPGSSDIAYRAEFVPLDGQSPLPAIAHDRCIEYPHGLTNGWWRIAFSSDGYESQDDAVKIAPGIDSQIVGAELRPDRSSRPPAP